MRMRTVRMGKWRFMLDQIVELALTTRSEPNEVINGRYNVYDIIKLYTEV